MPSGCRGATLMSTTVRPARTRRDAVYLDYAATTPVDPQVIKVMTRCLGLDGIFGNPSSRSHSFGWEADEIVENARCHVAELINADSSEIIWTSGATESINIAIKGIAQGGSRHGNHIVTSSLEHKAVLETCKQLSRQGFEVTYVGPDCNGQITPKSIEQALKDNTVLVSLMHVNNEIGSVTDIDDIGQVTRSYGVPFHVDAAQSVTRLPLDVCSTQVDLLSLSAHKMYGPKGVGALYVHRESNLKIEPQMHGGGQEQGIRPGTLATHQLAGMGEAARLLRKRRDHDCQTIAALDDRLTGHLVAIGQTRINGNESSRIPGIVNISFESVDSESLMMYLKDVAFSSGSACTSDRIEPSHVLRSLGLPDDISTCAVRFSIGRFTTPEQIDFVAERVTQAVHELRQLSYDFGNLRNMPNQDP